MTARRQRAARATTRSKPGGRASNAGAAEPPRQPARITPQVVWLAAGLAVMTIAAYAAVGHHEFVSVDDPAYVTDNPHIAGGLSWQGVIWAFTSGYAANWHPLTWISHMLDLQLFGMAPGAAHVTSLALHVAGTLLLFAFLVRTTRAAGPSAFVAALFAVHPLHVESVAWVAERKDVLSGACWWLTLIAYVAYVARPSLARYLAVAAALAAGLMAKPMLVTVPLTMLIVDGWPLRRVKQSSVAAWLPCVREKLLFFAMAAGASLVTYLVQSSGGAVRGLEVYPLSLRIENALVTTVTYAGKMFWPTNLAVYYPHPSSFPIWEPVGAGLLLIGVSVIAIRAADRAPYVTAGWFWYLVTLAPVIGLVQVGTQAMADRYTYVPLVGLFVIVAWGVPDAVARVPAARKLLPATAIAIVLACAAMTRAQVAYWQDSVTLWAHAVEATADVSNFGAHNTLALALRDRGRTDEAIAEFREAIRLNPHFAVAQRNLAQLLISQGRPAEAIDPLVALTTRDPNDSGAERDLGFALAQLGRADEAIPHFQASLRLQPDQVDVRKNLGSTLARVGRTDEGLRVLTDLTRDHPADADAQNSLGLLLAGLGRTADARVRFAEAARLKPDFADARANLGVVLTGEGRFTEAIAEFTEAVRLKPDLERARIGYGNALALAGRYEEATVQFQAALRLNPNDGAARQALASLAKRGK